MNEDRIRKGVIVALGALIALQIYFVQELLAALLLLVAVFVFIAIFTSLIFLVRKGGQHAATWVEPRMRAAIAKSRVALAFVATLSKTPSHRPHSRPAP